MQASSRAFFFSLLSVCVVSGGGGGNGSLVGCTPFPACSGVCGFCYSGLSSVVPCPRETAHCSHSSEF